ncbi:hypothetical protein AB0E69_13020 [Kribbella sp. NPDC026611]|uniref:hypothetical protein n=1 Tax=Kribbella sp. NPDC026611 TaxID=3154911 RepID=UPI0033C8B28D
MSRPGISSRKLAGLAFAANLVLCGLIGTSLLLLRTPDDHATAAPPKPTSAPTTPAQTTPQTPSTTPSDSKPSNTPPSSTPPQQNASKDVSGPGGITTKIPATWPAKVRSTGTDAQATNPTQPTSFLRYGGSPAPGQPLIDLMRTTERSFSTKYPGYQLIGLTPGTWRTHESVSWTFEFDTADGRKHVESVYWRAGSTDYVLYASSLLTNWPAMKAIYTTAYNSTNP